VRILETVSFCVNLAVEKVSVTEYVPGGTEPQAAHGRRFPQAFVQKEVGRVELGGLHLDLRGATSERRSHHTRLMPADLARRRIGMGLLVFLAAFLAAEPRFGRGHSTPYLLPPGL